MTATAAKEHINDVQCDSTGDGWHLLNGDNESHRSSHKE